jgi:transglutaminase-like putative cysteine protease
MASAIEDRLTYSPGITDVATTAARAWQHGAGVCQDHTHVMIAVCRARGLPARYVSGYLTGEARAGAATHAWVDVWLDGMWVPIDVTHRCLATERWLRLAVGADYEAVSPVRGVRQGGGEESMQVQVSVRH